MLRSLRASRPVSTVLGPPPSPSEEEEPLLESDEPEVTPLPARQLWILCLMRFGEPLGYTVIFPFISFFLEDLKVTDKPEKIGYYAGIIESLFAFTTFATVLAWGRLSDRIGRKPVMMIGLTGVALSVSAFGMSKSFVALVVSRCLGGALNGNVAVIKSMIAEITDSTNQGRAFSYLPLAWSIGSVLGPLIGGSLSNPAKNFPSVFGGNRFFETYPYSLPCFVAALFPTAGVIIGFFFLEETLTPRTAPVESIAALRGAPGYGARTSSTVPLANDLTKGYDTPAGSSTPRRSEETARETIEDEAPLKAPPPPFKVLFGSKRVVACLVVYALLALETVALDAIFVLFCYSRVSLGGLGFGEADIGLALSVGGLSTVFFQVVAFPPMQRRIGTTRLYRWLMSLYPLVFLLFPTMGYFARVDHETERGKTRVWIAMSAFLVVKSIANCSYATNMLSISDASPSRRLLGTLNGVAQMCSSLMRSIGPLAASSLFAFSASHRLIAHGQLVWIVMISLSIASAFSTLYLVDGPAAWRVAEEAEREPLLGTREEE